MRMFGIDAPEMPGACRPGRQCTPGDPYAARDHLRSLTEGRTVVCAEKDIDSYGRPVVRCTADGEDLSCAMVAAGQAVERYGRLNCDTLEATPQAATQQAAAPLPDQQAEPQPEARTENGEPRYFAPANAQPVRRGVTIAWLFLSVWVIIFNLLGWGLMSLDRRRADGPLWKQSRIPEPLLLLLALLGGGLGIFAAQQALDHKTSDQPFATLLLLITGLEFGLLLGLITLAMI